MFCFGNSSNTASKDSTDLVLSNPVYTIQPVVKSVVQPVDNRLYTRYSRLSNQPVECLYTGYNRLSNGFDNRFDNRLYRVYKHLTGCQTGLTTGLTTGCIV